MSFYQWFIRKLQASSSLKIILINSFEFVLKELALFSKLCNKKFNSHNKNKILVRQKTELRTALVK